MPALALAYRLHHQFHCLVPGHLVQVRRVLPVLPVRLGRPEPLGRHRWELRSPVRLERLALPEPVSRQARWRYSPYPAQGHSGCTPPKPPSPRKR